MPKGISKTYTSEKRSAAMRKVWKNAAHKKAVKEGQQKTFKTEAYKKQQSEAQQRRWSSKSRRQKQSRALSLAWQGRHEKWSDGIRRGNTDAVREKKSKTRKSLMLDQAYASEAISKVLSQRQMTVPEKQLQDILKLLNLAYRYVGNGRLMIGRYCPDFVSVHAKALIEVQSYHHKSKRMQEHDAKRTQYLKSQGYKVLVVWQEELKNIAKLASRLKRFDATL